MIDALDFQGILYPPNFECFRRKRTCSTDTRVIANDGDGA